MKTTKHIKTLAKKLALNEIKECDYYKDSDLEYLTNHNITHLNEVKEALLKGRYYTCVTSVSSSGMSRTIKIKYIKNNKLIHVSCDIYDMAGCDSAHRIRGCGMDMLFEAQYNIFRALCPNMDYSKKMKQYNNL